MDPEVQASTDAPETTETASVVEAPVSGEQTPEQEQKPEKVFTQDELNAIVAKEKAKVERKAQREHARLLAEVRQQPAAPAEKPTPDKFATTEEYVEALAGWKAEEILSKKVAETQKQGQEQAQRAQHEEVLATFREREDKAREVHDDFDAVAYNPRLVITDAMAATIQQSEVGPELAYYLGKNPQEAERIAKLSPFLQAKELGRLEAKLPTAEPAKQTSSAPEPINPVSAKKGTTPVLDTTDPKSLERMGTSAWIAAERERQRKKWERDHR